MDSKPNHRTEHQKTRSLHVPNGELDSRDSHPNHCGGSSSPPPFPGISKLSPEHSTSLDAYLESESLSPSDPSLSPSPGSGPGPGGKGVINNGLNGFGDDGVNGESSEEEGEEAVETTV